MQKRLLSSAKDIYRYRNKIIESLCACASTINKKCDFISKIILFGSIARGDYGLYSDADILIILKQTKYKRYFDRIPELLDFFGPAKIPVEIFPYTIEEIERMKNNGNLFIIRALKEGIEL